MTAPVYDRIGHGYAARRRPDPRIAERIDAAIGDARSVVNVGAGTGSYEPIGAVAVEPSSTMIAQRTTTNPVVRGVAEALPFADRSFELAMAVITIHHWPDLEAGLTELRRVSERQVVVTFDPEVHNRHWLVADYLPEMIESTNLPSLDSLGATTIEVVEVPHDCIDQFMVASWRRPTDVLDRMVRAAASGLALQEPAVVDAAMARLADDLASGAWAARHAHLLSLDTYDVGLRILTSTS